jgi:hypothetical protein
VRARWRTGRADQRPAITQHRNTFEDLHWQAILQGCVLTRERRFLGAIYALTPSRGSTVILYDLGEVRGFLERDRAGACATV